MASYITIRSLILCLTISFSQGQVNKAIAANCKLWKVPIAVDPTNHNNRPFYVEMHRCLGQCTKKPAISPRQCGCVPATTQSVTLEVISAKGYVKKTFQNHTSCKSECKAEYKAQCIVDGNKWNEHTCKCSCSNPPNGACPQNQVWNSATCQCECSNSPTNCAPGKFWNKSICGCQCSVKMFTRCSQRGRATNLQTCRCEAQTLLTGQVGKLQKNHNETKLIVSLVGIGLLLVILFIIDFFLMRSKKGFMYGLASKCREKKANQRRINETAAETGSITLDTDANYSVVNGKHKHRHQYIKQESIADV